MPTVARLGRTRLSREENDDTFLYIDLVPKYESETTSWAYRLSYFEDDYAKINGHKLREAIDALQNGQADETLRVVGVLSPKWYAKYTNRLYHGHAPRRSWKLSRDGDRLVVHAPCGDVRRYKLSTVDRMLSRLGF